MHTYRSKFFHLLSSCADDAPSMTLMHQNTHFQLIIIN